MNNTSDYIYDPESGELYHYGVVGMKWGVRRARKFQSKANAGMQSSRKSLEKAKRYNDRGKEKKIMPNAVDAAESAYNAQRKSEKADRIMNKHEQKFQKRVARNEKRIERAKRNNVDPETIKKKEVKAKKFIAKHELLTKELNSITKQTDEQQRRVHDFVNQMNERTYWKSQLKG